MTIVDTPAPVRRRPAPAAYRANGSAAVAVSAPLTKPGPRRQPAPRPAHLRVVRPTDRARRHLTPAVAVALTAALFATLLALAVAHTVLVQGQVRLDELDAHLTIEQARYQELRQEVAVLESPSRIEAAARAQGMVIPDDLRYLQPPAAVGPTPGYDDEPDADPTVGGAPDRTWSSMKPLLEAAAP
jgi:cell division protein FtsL